MRDASQQPAPARKNYVAVKVFVAVWLGLAALTAAVVPASASTLMHTAEALFRLVDAQVLLILVPLATLILFILAEAARQIVRGNRPRDTQLAPRRVSWSRR
jgi:hypothetical protein